jgi:hypothetical protein
MAVGAGIRAAAYSVAELGGGPTVDGDLRVVVNGGQQLVTRTLAGVPPAGMIAVSAGRAAIVPLAPTATYSRRTLQGTIEVRDLRSGALDARIDVAGRILALALTERTVVALVRGQDRHHRIRWWSPGSGAPAGSSTLSGGPVRPSLDAQGPRVVYRVGREMRVLRTDLDATRLVRRVGVGAGAPQIAGRTVAWPSYGSRYRIVGAILPRIR